MEDSEIDEQIILCTSIIALCSTEERKKSRKRKIWVKEWLKKRPKYSHINLLSELKESSLSDYKNFLRMDDSAYEELLELVAPFLQKQITVMRDDVISPHEQLSTTLRFLATGQAYEDIKYWSRIAAQTIGQFILPVCNAIIRVLKQKKTIKTPSTKAEWKEISLGFERRWNFPHCIGAIDGKHIAITKPPNSGSYYFNYKKTFSIVLLALANANYEFIMVDAGANGRVSDGGVQNNSKFFDKLEKQELDLPEPDDLPAGNFGKVPYVIVADDAFALSENLMKPHKGNMTDEQRVFGYRLSRARRIIENCFGILANRFRILLTTINLSPKKVEKIVLACCYLHNYIIQRNKSAYIQGDVDVENFTTGQVHEAAWRSERQILPLQPTQRKNSGNSAKEVRNKFCIYFNTVGAVPWQWKMVGLIPPNVEDTDTEENLND